MLEKIETLNKRLQEYFGLDTESDRPIWRLVWSDDQFEKQLLDHTPEGFQLIYPRWYEVPKYKMIGVKERFVLERLVLVPTPNQKEMTVAVSYEPMWVFTDRNDNFIYPKWEAIKHIVDCVYAAIGKHNSTVKYPDPKSGMTTKDLVEEERDRIKTIQEDLFGNETDVTDALNIGDGVVVPSNYEKKEKETIQ